MQPDALSQSGALWNRSHLDLRSDEILTQVLDRGELPAWRALFALAQVDPVLRGRIRRLVETVPMATGWFWLAALAALGEPVQWRVPRGEDGV